MSRTVQADGLPVVSEQNGRQAPDHWRSLLPPETHPIRLLMDDSIASFWQHETVRSVLPGQAQDSDWKSFCVRVCVMRRAAYGGYAGDGLQRSVIPTTASQVPDHVSFA